jgi:hypothetical protein
MKLLAKSDILKQKAEAQRVAVNEGVTLAKRVDRLREVMADEERSLEDFRKRTLAQIHEETTKASQKLDFVLDELAKAGMALAEARKPLDHEWALLALEKDAVAVTEAELRKDHKRLEKRLDEANKALQAARGTLARAKTKEEAAANAADVAFTVKAEAQQLITDATRIANESAILKETTELMLAKRKQELDFRDEQLNKKAELLEQERILQVADRIRLHDREQTLEREFNRLKKKQ